MSDETQVQKQVRLVLEQQCSDIGRVIAEALPAGTGFVLVMHDFGVDGNMAFLSSSERPSTIKMLEELVAKMKADA